jgi:creatinine amidohydrolase
MKARPYILTEINWKFVKEVKYELAVLPWGATEAHNYHLPYGTDNIQCDYIAAEAAAKAWEQGAKVIVLPTVPFGVNTQQVDIPLTMNLNPSTQLKILDDIISALNLQGIRRVLIMNGHGGNDFKQMIREIKMKFPQLFIGLINWYLVEKDWSKYFTDTGDHAGEMETSIMMNIVPELLLPLDQAGDGKARKLKFSGRDEGWLWAPREWTKVSQDTGIGNPKQATKEKGRLYLEKVIEKISAVFVEICKSDPRDIYN